MPTQLLAISLQAEVVEGVQHSPSVQTRPAGQLGGHAEEYIFQRGKIQKLTSITLSGSYMEVDKNEEYYSDRVQHF